MSQTQPEQEREHEPDAQTTGFEAIIQADRLDEWLSLLDPVVGEARIHVSNQGFATSAVDPANVGLAETQLHQLAFESLQIENGGDREEDALTLGVDLERLEDIIGMAESGELVHLKLNVETRKLNIQIGGLEYTLALIDPDSIRGSSDIPDLDIPVEASIPIDELDQAVDAADLVSDHVGIEFDSENETVVIDAEGDTDDMRFEADGQVHDRSEDSVRSLLSLEYVEDMVGAIPSDTDVNLRFGQEMPVKMSFEAEDDERDEPVSETVYMVAPRIQSD